jgi:hypothetical protein
MAAMGLELLHPPSVKGWDMGPAWLSSTTLLARYRFAQGLAVGGDQGFAGELNAEVRWESLGGAGEGLLGWFFPEGLPAPLVQDLLQSAAGDPRALVAGCLELPEYQFV